MVLEKQRNSSRTSKAKSIVIPLSKPVFTEEMKMAALNSLQNERFVMGESVFKFEEEFAKYCGTEFAVSTSSGTCALQLSLLAMVIKQQSEVITSSASFVATANAVVHLNAVPVFVDTKADSFNIDPLLIDKGLTPKTAAVIPVHLYGFPADMNEILEICRRRRIAVLEDACQAHGALYFKRKAGAIGDAGCFSFYSTKNMTVCGDGGMVVSDDDKIAERVAKLRDCGRVSHYEHDMIGFTSRLNTVNAAIGRVQLKLLDHWNERRISLARLYNQLLSDLDQLKLPLWDESKVKPAFHLYVIRTHSRNLFKAWLEERGVECGVHYPLPIHLQPIYRKVFGYKRGTLPQCELLSKTALSLPMFPSLTEDQVRYVCESIQQFFDRHD